jgi:hypothetical protein
MLYLVPIVFLFTLPQRSGTFLVPGSVVPESTAWAVPGYSTKLICDIKEKCISLLYLMKRDFTIEEY